MALNIGKNTIAKIYSFDRSVGKIYLGDSQIWAGSPYSDEATAVLSRYSNLSQTETDAIVTFVDAEVLAGNWDLIEEFYCFALNTTDRKVGFKHSTGTNNGATEDAEGYTFRGSGDYFDTGYNAYTDAQVQTLNNSGFGFYCHKNNYEGSGANTIMFGVSQSNVGQFYRYNVVGARTGIHSANSNNPLYILLDDRTSYQFGRIDGSSYWDLVLNGANVGSGSATANAIQNSTQKIGSFSGGNWSGTISTAVFFASFGFDYEAHRNAEKQLLEDLGVDTFTPYDYAPEMDYDASWYPSIVTSDGTHVSTWYNKRYINAKNLSQATAANQPSYNPTLKKVSFTEDVNRVLQGDFSATPFDNENIEVFIVGKKTDNTRQVVLYCFDDVVDGTAPYEHLEYQFRANSLTMFIGNGASYSFPNLNLPSPFPDATLERSIFNTYCDIGDGRYNKINETNVTGIGQYPGYLSYQSTNMKYFRVGNRSVGHTFGGAVEVNEIIIYDKRLSTTQRQNVVAYLKNKWYYDVASYSPNYWLDSTEPQTLTKSGSNVSAWASLGSAGGNWSQGTAALQPIENGDGVEFQEAHNYLNSSTGAWSNDFTAIIVSKTINQYHQDPNVFRDENMLTEERWNNGTTPTASKFGVRFNGTWNLGNTNTSFGVKKVDAVVRSSSATVATLYKNGVQDGQFTGITSWQADMDAVYRYFGGRYNSTDYNGKVYEIVLFKRALDSGEIAKISTALMNKYSIT